jgi:hypothetical protein
MHHRLHREAGEPRLRQRVPMRASIRRRLAHCAVVAQLELTPPHPDLWLMSGDRIFSDRKAESGPRRPPRPRHEATATVSTIGMP